MNYCPSCGQKVEPNDNFCLSCGQKLGASSEPEQITNNETAAALEPNFMPFEPVLTRSGAAKSGSNRFLGKKGIFALVIIVVLASSALAYNLVFKQTPKELYLLSELNSVKHTMSSFQNKYKDDIDLWTKLAENPSQTQLELSGNVNFSSGELYDSNRYTIDMISNLLKDSKLVIQTESDPKKRLSNNNISYLYRSSPIISADLFQTTKDIGIRVPVLYDKYLYVQNDQFGNFMRKLDPYYSGPEDLNQFNWNQLNLEKSDWNKLARNYGDFLIENLSEDYFTLEKGISYDSPEGEKKLRKLTLAMNKEQTHEFFGKLLDKMSQDDELLNILADNAAKMAKLPNGELKNAASIKAEIKNSFDELNDEFKNIEFPDGLSMILFINGDETIVDRQLNLTIADKSSDGVDLDLHMKNWEGDKEASSSYDIDLKPMGSGQNGSRITLNLANKSTEENNGTKNKLTGSFVFYDSGRNLGNINLKVDTLSSTEKGDGRKVDSDFTLTANGDEFETFPDISGTITETNDQNLSKNYSNKEYGIDLKLGLKDYYYGKQEVNVSLNLKNQIKFIDQVEVPSLQENAIDLTNASQDELYGIYDEVGYSIQKFIGQNQSLFGQFY